MSLSADRQAIAPIGQTGQLVRVRREPVQGDVSALLRAWSDGDHRALDALTPILYAELRRPAARHSGMG